MEIQDKNGCDLGQNGGNGVVSGGQTLAIRPIGFALDQRYEKKEKSQESH